MGGEDHGVLRRAQGQDEVKTAAVNCAAAAAHTVIGNVPFLVHTECA